MLRSERPNDGGEPFGLRSGQALGTISIPRMFREILNITCTGGRTKSAKQSFSRSVFQWAVGNSALQYLSTGRYFRTSVLQYVSKFGSACRRRQHRERSAYRRM